MANSQLLALACLAVLAASAVAAPAAGCTVRAENLAGTLKEQVPKNCLASKKVQTALMDLIKPTCFNSVKMNVTNSTGTACEMPGTFFNVSFADAANCLDGMDIGGGEMTPVPAGGSSVKGEFPLVSQTFTGSSTPAGLFTVTVAGMDCQLIYTTKTVGKPNITTTGAAADAMANATKAADAGAAPAASPEPAAAPKKSSAAAAAPAALMALVAGALALAF